MSTTVTCPNCFQKLKAPSAAIGKLVRCGCGHSFVLDNESTDEFSQMIESPPALPASPALPKKRIGPVPERYPWLRWYLKFLRSLAIGIAVLGIILSLLLVVLDIAVLGSLKAATVGGSLILFFSSIGECILIIAAVEFVKVILDIEENTRSLLEIARQRFE